MNVISLPDCTIIIPLFNKEVYLHSALQSIRAQTYQNFEVLIIDDGSTDDGFAIAQSFGDARFFLHKQENSGVSVARNNGISRSRGAFIFFFDADDWMHPYYLEFQIKLFNKLPFVGAVASRFLRFSDDIRTPSIWIPEPKDEFLIIDNLPDFWMLGQCFITSSFAVRRSVLFSLESWFPLNESVGEDMDLWFRIAETAQIALNEAPLIGYRQGSSESLTVISKSKKIPQYLIRMGERARGGSLPKSLALSTLRFVHELRVSHSRSLLIQGFRGNAFMQLYEAALFGLHRRWWMTLFMSTLMSSSYIRKREEKRIKRTQRYLEDSSQQGKI